MARERSKRRREDLSRRRLGARRAPRARASSIATGWSSARRPRSSIASGYKPVGRDFPGLPPSRYGRGICARPHGAQARTRLPRLRILRLARRDARRGSRPPRPHDQRDGARREGRADRSVRRAGRSSRRRAAPCFAGIRRGSAARAARRALRRALRVHRRAGNRAADARARRVGRARRAVRRSASGRSSRAA